MKFFIVMVIAGIILYYANDGLDGGYKQLWDAEDD